jgi:RecB family exonuclease
LIPHDQYELYGLPTRAHYESDCDDALNWLRACASHVHLSTSAKNASGNGTSLPVWANPHNVMPSSGALTNLKNRSISLFAGSNPAKHVEKVFSDELNDINALAELHIDRISATSMEDYFLCPSLFFHRRILHGDTPDEIDDADELIPLVLGNFIHARLDEYVSRNLTREQLDNVITEHITKMENDGEIAHRAARILLSRRMKVLVDNFLVLHERSQAEILGVEEKVEGAIDSSNISLRGKIDRIHVQDAKRVFVDYKTGKLNKSSNAFHFGRKIQLALYALITDNVPDRLEYWYLKDIPDQEIIEWNSETQNEAKELARSATSMMETGTFIPREFHVAMPSAKAKLESPCQRCEYETYCYREHRALWPKHKNDSSIAQYSHVTGEDLIEDTQ